MASTSRIQALRKQRGWTQEQLAQCSGISVRTLQRLENGEPAAAETLQAVAAVLGIPVSELLAEQTTGSAEASPAQTATASPPPSEEAMLQERVLREAKFLRKAMSVGAVLIFLFIINLITTPGVWWVIWPALGMGLFLALRAIRLFTDWMEFGPSWQQRRIERLRTRT